MNTQLGGLRVDNAFQTLSNNYVQKVHFNHLGVTSRESEMDTTHVHPGVGVQNW